jgi:hypothetical protein
MTYRITWVAIALLFTGCSTTHDPLPNKSTNWLRECTADRMCGDGLSCLCGLCTKTCGRTADCSPDPASTRCTAVSEAALSQQCTPGATGDAEAICVAACVNDGDCPSSAGDFECRDQVCVVRTGAGTAGTVREDAGRDASISMSDAGHSIGGEDGGLGREDGGLSAGTCNVDAPCEVPCNATCKSDQVCLGDACADVLASDQASPSSQALDSSRLYWTTIGTRDAQDNSRNDGAVQAVSLKSGELTTLASNRSSPRALAINATHAYWLESSGTGSAGAVWRVPLAGGDPEQLASALPMIDGLAVDESYVYLLTEDTPNTTTTGSAVQRMPNDGSAQPERLFDVEGHGGGLYVDATGLCWANSDKVGTASKDGTDAHVLSTSAAAIGNGLYMAVDASIIYWTDSDSADLIASVPRAGGDAHVLVQETTWDTAGIALDRDSVYWGYQEAQTGIWTIARIDKARGTSQVLLRGAPLSSPRCRAAATTCAAPMTLSVDDDAIYIVVPGDPSASNGMVLRAAKQ